MREKKERMCALREAKKEEGSLLIQPESVYIPSMLNHVTCFGNVSLTKTKMSVLSKSSKVTMR